MAELVGDWVLDEPIGRGAGSVVHRGHHRLHPDQPVAIKRVVSDGAEGAIDPAAVATLRHEAGTLARLAHPAIIPFTDVVDDGSGVALVMPLAPGGSLAAQIRNRGALSWPEVADLGARLAGALAAAHGAGIVHRDVTPGNVLYGRELEPRLADFGAAVLEGDDHHVVGTPGYLDPEVARGAPAGPPGDVYGLGVVLYEALAGQPPFAGATPEAVLRSADRGVHLPLAALVPDAPAELAAVVERAMARDPADRHGGAQQLQVALEHVVLTAPDPGEEASGLAHPADVLPPPTVLSGTSPQAGQSGGPTSAHASAGVPSDDTMAMSFDDGACDQLAPTTDFGPRPIAPLDIEEPHRPWWMVAALVAVVVLPLGVAAWALLANRVDDTISTGTSPTVATPTAAAATAGSSTGAPTAAATTAPARPTAPTTPATPTTPSPAPTTTPGPSDVALVPRVPAPPCDGVDPPATDDLQADVDGRGCSLPISVTPGPESTTLDLPAEAGPLAGDYRLEGPPVFVVVGDWDGDGVDTPAITVDDTGVVFAFDAWGEGQSTAIGVPIGAAAPLVVTGPDGVDRVVADERA